MIQLKSQIKKFGLIFVAMLIGAFQSQAAKTHLNMGMVLEPPHLDPTAGAAAAIDEVVYANVFEGLTRINRNGEVSTCPRKVLGDFRGWPEIHLSSTKRS